MYLMRVNILKTRSVFKKNCTYPEGPVSCPTKKRDRTPIFNGGRAPPASNTYVYVIDEGTFLLFYVFPDPPLKGQERGVYKM